MGQLAESRRAVACYRTFFRERLLILRDPVVLCGSKVTDQRSVVLSCFPAVRGSGSSLIVGSAAKNLIQAPVVPGASSQKATPWLYRSCISTGDRVCQAEFPVSASLSTSSARSASCTSYGEIDILYGIRQRHSYSNVKASRA